VAKGFKGISTALSAALLDRAEAYQTLDKLPTSWGSLVNPDILAQVDAEILGAAQEIHGEQQVAYLNEIADAYKAVGDEPNKLTNSYASKAQKEWLNDNPLLVISKDENLNNAVISIEEQTMKAMMQSTKAQAQTQAQAQVGQIVMQPPLAKTLVLGENSILMPEPTKKKSKRESVSESEGSEGEGSEGNSEGEGTEVEGSEGSESEDENKGKGNKKTVTFNF
jgi:hypothetical protein